MSLPLLSDLPAPPAGKTGWPWTEGSAEPSVGEQAIDWPKISIITPSYNQGHFLEETIRSVLLQGYPKLEYFIMDGGSTDDSVAIIRKYEPWLAGWVSKKDGGQADAINQGWEQTAGEVLGWLNSDDWYVPGALLAVGRKFAAQADCKWLICSVDNYWSNGELQKRTTAGFESLVATLGRKDYRLHQPGMFWRREVYERVGGLDRSLHYSFDHEYWIRFLMEGYRPVCVAEVVVNFRLHEQSKTQSNLRKAQVEDRVVLSRHRERLTPAEIAEVEELLDVYEAGYWVDNAYLSLVQEGRQAGLRYLWKSRKVARHVRPKKLVWGTWLRILLTGKPPGWFGRGPQG
jgi:glycosyltransferase involved in cell wall biosynthesis